jgi:hypothetical protein
MPAAPSAAAEVQEAAIASGMAQEAL